ncbi:MAG: hypothetical protein CVV47_03515 [Spirochaetae bacterium HGW-Spirochaetae-3]|nr:MAG: hypothetical protein CVV47_03515 [Spirochaetae bacterium HGW-Spirochaetae-3]
MIIVAPIWIARRIRVDPGYALLCISGGLFFGLELACWNLSGLAVSFMKAGNKGRTGAWMV